MPNLPGVNHLKAVRALKKAGFRIARQGKHIVMTNGSRIITIPRHNPVNAVTIAIVNGKLDNLPPGARSPRPGRFVPVVNCVPEFALKF